MAGGDGKRVVHVDLPASARGVEVEVPGLGLLKNKQDNTVTAEQVGLFESLGFKFPKTGKLELPIKADTVVTPEEGGE